MPFVSYAQNREDVLLFRALQDLKSGFYIDIGANHPKIDSVTQAFYDRGWCGVNVEPIQENHAKLIRARQRDTNLNVAISDFTGAIDFYDVNSSGLSTTVSAHAEEYATRDTPIEKYSVPCLTLQDLCTKYANGDIHFLKVDVEGAEEQVIRGGNWKKYRPWIVLIESTLPNTRTLVHHDWEPILLHNRYRFVSFDGLNRFYVADEKRYLIDSFSAPVCNLDKYIPYSEYKLLQSFHLMQLDIENQKALIVDLDHANKNMMETLNRVNGYLVVRALKKILRQARLYKKRTEPFCKPVLNFIKAKIIGLAALIYRVSPSIYERLQTIWQKWRKLYATQ